MTRHLSLCVSVRIASLVGDAACPLPSPVVVFEVISLSSGHVDRIIKVREYGAVETIRRYVIGESASVGLTVHERAAVAQKWSVTTLMAGDVLLLPEIGVEILVAELDEVDPGNWTGS